jgi:hypothetical protein
MGAALAKAAYRFAARAQLDHLPTRVLVFMATTALDSDAEAGRSPRCFLSRDSMLLGIGYDVDDPNARTEKIRSYDESFRRAVNVLLAVGAIDRTRHASRGRTAEYTLTRALIHADPSRRVESPNTTLGQNVDDSPVDNSPPLPQHHVGDRPNLTLA